MKASRPDLESLVVHQAQQARMVAAWAADDRRAGRHHFTLAITAATMFHNLRKAAGAHHADWRMVIRNARLGVQIVREIRRQA